MREKLETLSLANLRELAKANGIKSVTVMRKAELIDKLIEIDEKSKAEKEKEKQQENTANTKPVRQVDYRYNERGDNASSQSETIFVREQQSQGYNQQRLQGYAGQAKKNSGSYSSQNNFNQPHQGNARQNNDVSGQHSQEADGIVPASGILEVMPDGFAFIRCDNFLPGENDVYVSPSQVRRFNLKTGDILKGKRKLASQTEKYGPLVQLESVNGLAPEVIMRRKNFEDLTPVFPHDRIRLSGKGSSVAMRVVDIMSPIGKGQRGMIVSQPKAGKTTLLKQIAKAITANDPKMHLIILLIDERPEEVTDMKETIHGSNVEVIYSTFDEMPEKHKRVSEMVIERAKRLVEQGQDVTILLDSITRLARAYNLTVTPSGRTLSGGLDPASLYMPKRFFGAARCMREGGSLTILATALVETGSKMDDVVFEEFKGTGNMELVLDRKLSEKRIFPAIDIAKSGTRNENLLLDREEYETMEIIRRALNGMRKDEAVESILDTFVKTRDNVEFIQYIKKNRIF